MQQIADWLKTLGMSEYADRFVENRIDHSVLPDLTDQDLEKLGFLLGDRRKMLRAIRELAGDTAVTPHPPRTEPKFQDTAERRQLTVMFCDLVGSTALSARLDPEDLRGIIGAYHRRCAEVITKSGGFVARYMGDGVLAYFGYPQAHEHDAERAVLAGLALVEAVAKLDDGAGTALRAWRDWRSRRFTASTRRWARTSSSTASWSSCWGASARSPAPSSQHLASDKSMY